MGTLFKYPIKLNKIVDQTRFGYWTTWSLAKWTIEENWNMKPNDQKMKQIRVILKSYLWPVSLTSIWHDPQFPDHSAAELLALLVQKAPTLTHYWLFTSDKRQKSRWACQTISCRRNKYCSWTRATGFLHGRATASIDFLLIRLEPREW